MNPEPAPALQRDLFAAAAARLRQRLRRRRITRSLISFALLASLAALALRPTQPVEILTPAPAPPAIPPLAPQPAPPYEKLTTDDALVAALADQGPMLITHADGRKQLILTRPH
jgi:hypothetical protein